VREQHHRSIPAEGNVDFLNTDDAPNLIALRITDKIQRADMEEITRRVEQITARDQKVRIYVEVESFPRITWDALKEDLDLGIKHFRDFEAKIVVTDMTWTEPLTRVFDALFPSFDLRQFRFAERDEALAYAKGTTG